MWVSVHCTPRKGQKGRNMFTARIAYRHENGQVEGFLGTALQSASAADAAAQRLIQSKVADIGGNYDPQRIIRHESVVTGDELKMIRADWNTYLKGGILGFSR